MTLRVASQGLGIDQTRISHAEAGRVGVSAGTVRRMAAHYSCLDTAVVDALAAMTGERPKQWWDTFRRKVGQTVLDLAELEHHAHGLRMLQASYVPGLLQIEDYMRGVMSYPVPEPPPQELDMQVEFRLQRRRVLDREPALHFHAVIHEAALRTRVADRRVARSQLTYLLEQADRSNVTVQVVSFDTDNFGAAGASILYAQASVLRLDTVHIDALPDAVWLDAEAQLAKYRALLTKVSRSALSIPASRDFIHRLAQEL
jgi:hypothetical protein